MLIANQQRNKNNELKEIRLVGPLRERRLLSRFSDFPDGRTNGFFIYRIVRPSCKKNYYSGGAENKNSFLSIKTKLNRTSLISLFENDC